MKLKKILSWLDRTLEVKAFDDVSNNGLQIARQGEDIQCVAFAVDASVRAIQGAAKAGAQLLVVHHGISWGGGIKRIVDSEYAVISEAIKHNLALYAAHLPLDANRRVGNNWELARHLKLKRLKKAFSYHGNVIGLIGYNAEGKKVGVCSGGAGEFAVEAKALGCDLYITGEASWGEEIAAENVGIEMVRAGHYETETFGVKALSGLMGEKLRLKTRFIGR